MPQLCPVLYLILAFGTLSPDTYRYQFCLAAFARCRHRRVSADVFLEMVGASKAPAAVRTFESFLSGVRTNVSLQFVRSTESFAAVQPTADKRALACMPPAQLHTNIVHIHPKSTAFD